MSTRSDIAIKRKDGTVESIYCHSDGYLEHNGFILYNFYKNPKKIDSLINLGSLSFLSQKVNPDPLVPHSFDWDKCQRDVTIAFGRDRGEKNTEKRVYDTLEDYLKSFDYSWVEYAYLYDESNNEWLWSPVFFSEEEKKMNFTSLEKKLNEMELIEHDNSDLENLINTQIEFEKKFHDKIYNECYESDEDAYEDFKNIFTTSRGLKNEIDVLKGYLYDIDNNLLEKEMTSYSLVELRDKTIERIDYISNYINKKSLEHKINDDYDI